ncbi:MAG: NUDIX hydrolase [Dehalococcoidia bacterium]|nr:NUDIX hydrolase [Dehalococcoidia bacterium]
MTSSDAVSGEIQPERAVGRRDVFDGRVIQLHVDEVELPNGKRTTREVAEHADAVVVLPIDESGRALLVRQYRYPIGKDLLEAPAGGIDPGEDPDEAAQRELQEEIGYKAGRLDGLGGFWTAPGFCTEYMYAYLAGDLSPSSLAPDEDEDIVVERHSLDAIREMIRDGRIVDAKTIAAYWMALDRLG